MLIGRDTGRKGEMGERYRTNGAGVQKGIQERVRGWLLD